MIPLECFYRVALGGIPNIAALRIENHRDAGVGALDIVNRALELIFRLVSRVVRELRLVGTHEIRGGVDDRLVELENRRRLVDDLRRKALDLGVEPDADERVVHIPCAIELFDELTHATRARALCPRFFRCTMRIDTAAGVMPGSRPASPQSSPGERRRVSGGPRERARQTCR